MKRYLYLVLVLVLLGVVTLQGCAGVSGTALTGSSTTTTSGATDTGSTSDTSGEFYQDAPVDIPVTIAKATEGIDATTVKLTATTSPSVSSSNLKTATKSSSTVTFNFTLKNVAADRLVLLVAEGNIIDSTTTSGGSGSFTVPIDIYGIPMALLVGQEGATVDSDGWSPPIIVTIYENGSTLIDAEQFMTVAITNTSQDASGALSAAYIYAFLAMDSASEVTFVAEDADSQPFLGKIDVTGSEDFTVFSTEPPNRLENISYDAGGILTAVDSTDNRLFRIATDGSVAYEEPDRNTLPDVTSLPDRNYEISPDNQWLAATTVENKDSSPTNGLVFINLDDTSIEREVDIGQSHNGTPNFTWMDNDSLIGFVGFGFGGSVLDVADILAGTSSTVNPSTLISDNGDIPVMLTDRNQIAYACVDDSNTSQSDLCLYDVATDAITTLVHFSSNEAILSIKKGANDDYVAVAVRETTSSDSSEIPMQVLGVYLLDQEEFVTLGKGFGLTPAPDDPNILTYISCDTNGDQVCDSDERQMQVCVYNLENFGVSF